MTTHQETQRIVETAAKYVIDSHRETVGNHTVEHFKTLVGAFTVADDRTMLLKGNVGSGKTTFTAMLSSVMTGLPADLYDTHKIQGHVEQTKDTMFCRLDLGKLQKSGDEEIIWEPALYLPTLTFDEINRITSGKHSSTLEFIRTGTMTHFGKRFGRGKFPFFATMNYNGAGTYDLTAAMKDRFDISFEFPLPTSFDFDLVETAKERQPELQDPEKTNRITEYMLRKDKSVKEKLDFIAKEAPKYTAARASLNALKARAKALEWAPGAITLRGCIIDECNSTPRYGEKRPEDPIDNSTHKGSATSDQAQGTTPLNGFAHRHILSPVSGRAMPSTSYYASMLAAYLGDARVTEDHLLAVAPYCLAHRIEFHADYKATHKESPRLRGEHEALDLTRRLLNGIDDNYRGANGIANDVRALDEAAAKLFEYGWDGSPKKNEAAVTKLKASDADSAVRVYANAKSVIDKPLPDHPHLQLYYNLLGTQLR